MIVFFSNFISHHQLPVAKELYHLTGGGFLFVEMCPIPDSYTKTGYTNYSYYQFVIRSWESKTEFEKACRLVLEADVVLYSTAALDMVKPRLATNKISFDVGERWLKKGIKNFFSPNLIKAQWLYHTHMNKFSNYKLCASAYASHDQQIMHSFIGRCYKWGYFTKVDYLDVGSLPIPRNGLILSLMWCARLIDWKHPELAIKLAAKLKDTGYSFILDIYGDGVLKHKMMDLAESYGVEKQVCFHGNVPNDTVLQEMRKHDVFLFTSDRNEGWGAVANEAMANGCVLVGSNEIGSIPYLIQDGYNGSVFMSRNLNSLFERVSYLLDNPAIRQEIAEHAYNTISQVWSPTNAARNLLQLIEAIKEGRETPIKIGPCSKA